MLLDVLKTGMAGGPIPGKFSAADAGESRRNARQSFATRRYHLRMLGTGVRCGTWATEIAGEAAGSRTKVRLKAKAEALKILKG